MVTRRSEEIDYFLSSLGWISAARKLLAGDASDRRYTRLKDGDRRAILMDSPPKKEGIQSFVQIARYLRGRGLSAPAILAVDEIRGLLLLEDLGDDIYLNVLGRGADSMQLYSAAVDLLAELQSGSPPRVPDYGESALLREASLFTDWYLPCLTGNEISTRDRREFEGLWRTAIKTLAKQPGVPVLRDFHSGNLIWLARRKGVARVGLLDFQDAIVGPAAYDVVSLLEDARRDVEGTLAEAMVNRFIDATGADNTAFNFSYALLGAQRNAKIIGIFTRLWWRDGKSQYLQMIPRVWRYLAHDLEHPGLADLKIWFDLQVPQEKREFFRFAEGRSSPNRP